MVEKTTYEVKLLAWLEWHSLKHWKRLQALYGANVLGPPPKIELSKRLIRAYGVAYNYEGLPDKAVIRYSLAFLSHKETLAAYECEIIPHEVAHIAAYRLTKDHCHGKTWYAVMARLGVPARTHFEASDYHRKEETNYGN